MKNALDVIRKNTMLIILVMVVLFFTAMTKGSMIQPSNFDFDIQIVNFLFFHKND